jgi:hypothetical protein
VSILAQKQRIRNSGYTLPDALRSFDEWLRLQNRDLEKKTRFELIQELGKTRAALTYLDLERPPMIPTGTGEFIPALEWLELRRKAVLRELRRRNRNG